MPVKFHALLKVHETFAVFPPGIQLNRVGWAWSGHGQQLCQTIFTFLSPHQMKLKRVGHTAK